MSRLVDLKYSINWGLSFHARRFRLSNMDIPVSFTSTYTTKTNDIPLAYSGKLNVEEAEIKRPSHTKISPR